MEFAEACIPEAIMCINVSSTRTRLAAYLVLQSIVEAMLRWRPDEKDDVFRLVFINSEDFGVWGDGEGAEVYENLHI